VGSYDQIECDDGNNRNGDGCSSDCLIEEDWKCKRGDEKTSLKELTQNKSKDLCERNLKIDFNENNQSVGTPQLVFKFGIDVCFDAAYFLEIYEP